MSRRNATTNPWIGVNYIADNPNMAVPPAYWLQRLFDFDAELVCFPSRYIPYAYVLARRRRISVKPWDKALADTATQPDTRLCLERGLVPVTLIYKTGATWEIDKVIRSLKARDIWSNGGADKAADLLDKREADDAEAARKQTRDDMYARSGLAYQLYKRRTGQRVSSAGTATKSRSKRKVSSPQSSVGSGIVLADR